MSSLGWLAEIAGKQVAGIVGAACRVRSTGAGWDWQANGHGLLVFGRRDWVQAGEQVRRDGPRLDGHASVEKKKP